MSRTPRRYSVHLHLAGGQRETVHFPDLASFQDWYQNVLNGPGTESGNPFVNVPIADLDGEYLVVRVHSVIGLRVEPQFSAVDDT
ncbi:hypothetical protein EVJ50_06960 [Synechococcus sp. RSCCF101]|uniref:hypothetical protein n=1 Tax=Synechococcus sp. RSCCF101 TaxID=2511069 RepID=UPI0012488292|nr:hypothetical protein [Synechococcus sp. RSCCF101]QEY32016.1 hypothetical protein EVJ50_06960 [Synechococcus sp. RSCCF101]